MYITCDQIVKEIKLTAFVEGPERDIPLPYPLGLKSLQILGMYQDLKTNVTTFLVLFGSKMSIGYLVHNFAGLLWGVVYYISNLCILLNFLGNSH